MSIGLRAFVAGFLVAPGGVVTADVKLPRSVEKWKENRLWNQTDFGPILDIFKILCPVHCAVSGSSHGHIHCLSLSLSHICSLITWVGLLSVWAPFRVLTLLIPCACGHPSISPKLATIEITA